jgi:Bacterial regulatory proteins, tetR family
LIAEGYEHFTIDTVTARARTSKPVLYRRWKTREDLLRATVAPPIRRPFPTPAPSGATSSLCSPTPTPPATPWQPW